MATGGFKHISVTAADEDDEVIVAGVGALTDDAVEEPVVSAQAEAAGLQAPEDADDTPDAITELQVEVEREPEGGSASDTAGSSQPATQEAGAVRSRKQPPAKDGYREATLKDLESTPMPLAQKIVIIAAVVCIIGAVIYYFVMMR